MIDGSNENLESVYNYIQKNQAVPIDLSLSYNRAVFDSQIKDAKIRSNDPKPNKWIPVIPSNTTARMDILTRNNISKSCPLFDFSSAIRQDKNSSVPLNADNLPTYNGIQYHSIIIRNDIGFHAY